MRVTDMEAQVTYERRESHALAWLIASIGSSQSCGRIRTPPPSLQGLPSLWWSVSYPLWKEKA